MPARWMSWSCSLSCRPGPGGGPDCGGGLDEAPDRGLGGAAPDERLADEHGASARTDVRGDVGGPGHTGLRDPDDTLGYPRQQVGDRSGVDLEGLEVAGVDAHEDGVDREGPVELSSVVHLDER